MKARLLIIGISIIALTACSTASKTPAALPTVVLEEDASNTMTTGLGGVTASGIVVPDQEAQMALSVSGNVKQIYVEVGELVQPGELLLELDNELAQVQFNLAQRNLKEMTSPASIAAAGQLLAAAKQNVVDTKKKVDSLYYRRASDTLIDNTEGEIDLAKTQLSLATENYNNLSRREDGDADKAAALVAMTNAQLRLNQLTAQLNWYTGKPSEIDALLVQANYDAAKAGLQEAEWYLAAVKGEEVPPDSTGKNLALLEKANADFEIARIQLENTRLDAPFAGTVADIKVSEGDSILPGVILIALSNLSKMHVETTDLSEDDVVAVKVGQEVTVLIHSLGVNVTGKVSGISPRADTLGGDVVYKTIIELNEIPEGLLSGMTVDVQY
jgi:multidrug efflux pump subunit AcrA (membrane-fusion protein)